jgi:peptidylprolyl isomerase
MDVHAQTPAPTQAQTSSKQKAPPMRNPVSAPMAEASPPAGQRPAPAEGGETVARVGGAEIKEDELRAFIAALGEREQTALARDPALLSQVVRQLLANQLVLKEALAKRWDQRPEVAEQLKRARENAIVDSYLRSVSQPPADFPGEAVVQNVYDANRSAFLVPRQFLIAQIFVALPSDADKAAAERASRKFADIQLKLKQPDADFAAIARADSDAKETSDSGGEIGWLAESQLRPEIKTVVLGLAKNAVSEPVKLDDGWHIVKLIDTKASYTRPIAEVRDQLVGKLRDEQSAAMRRAYVAELLKQTPPAINELALAKMLNENSQVSPR